MKKQKNTEECEKKKGEPENHLDVYAEKTVLHIGDKVLTFQEGKQNASAKKRYQRICDAFKSGYLSNVLQDVQQGKFDFSLISNDDAELLKRIVGGASENEGRAVVCICFLQLAIKSIEPKQSIRLHKGGGTRAGFSWVEGISMRTLDSRYTSKFLRENHLISMNSFGAMMTRSFAENYPYTGLYKAAIKGPADAWIKLVDLIEFEKIDSKLALAYMIVLLKNRSNAFAALSNKVCELAKVSTKLSFDEVREGLLNFIDNTTYSARALEVVMHGLMQALQEMDLLDDAQVVPLSQMRTANKKAGSIGDIEIKNFEGEIIETWDAKYGKPYLWDELVELGEKLEKTHSVIRAGFVVDTKPDLRADILDRKKEIERATKASISLMSFDEWARFQCGNVPQKERIKLANLWLIAVVESFGRKRLASAPIDEPCEKWLNDLQLWLEGVVSQ